MITKYEVTAIDLRELGDKFYEQLVKKDRSPAVISVPLLFELDLTDKDYQWLDRYVYQKYCEKGGKL